MRSTRIRCGFAVTLIVVAAGCGGSPPAAPTPAHAVGVAALPPITRPARVYIATHYSNRPSEFALYEDGTFELVYSAGPEYGGRYTEAAGVIAFDWDGWSAAGPWGATGQITGEALTVRFNAIMQLADFEDGVYVRKP